MSRTMKDILLFLCKVILSCGIIIATLRVYVWYTNKPLDTFVNMLFYLAIVFLTLGFLGVLITFLKGIFHNNNSEFIENNVQKEQENLSYKNLLNLTTLLILDGAVFMLFSFLLTFLISYMIATSGI